MNTRTPMTIREAMKEKAKARRFWDALSRWDRNELGDQFVLGSFDWRDWFETKPSAAFLNEVDSLRIFWEMTDE